MARADSGYEAYLLSRLPRWLLGTWGERWATVIGGMLDDVAIAGAKMAVRSGFVASCPDDAVPLHGRASLLDPVVGESVGAYRDRIQDRWTFWSTLGPTVGLRGALRTYVPEAPALEVYPIEDCVVGSWIDGFIGGGLDDDNIDNASRAAIVIPQPHPWDRPVVGPGLVVGPDLIVGIDMTGEQLSRVRRVWRKHRPGTIVGIDIYVIFDSTSAAVIRVSHDAADLVRIPLQRTLVGYEHHPTTVGSLVVGQEFS